VCDKETKIKNIGKRERKRFKREREKKKIYI
jgi:hypothetical protein